MSSTDSHSQLPDSHQATGVASHASGTDGGSVRGGVMVPLAGPRAAQGTGSDEPPRAHDPRSGRSAERRVLDSEVAYLDLVDRIRRTVLDDIVSRDKLLLADTVYARIEERANVRRKDEIQNLIGAEFSNRVKNLVALVTVVIGILGFLGFTVVRDAMTSEARKAATIAAEKEVEDRVRAIDRRIDGFSDAVKLSMESLSQKERQLQASASQAIFDVVGQTSTVMGDTKLQVDDVRRQVIKNLDDLARELKESAKQEMDSIRKTAVADVIMAAEQRINTIKETARESVEAVQKSKGGQSDSTAATSPNPDHGEAEHPVEEEEELRIAAQRDFQFQMMIKLARRFSALNSPRHVRSVLDPLLNNPLYFKPEERLAAAKLITDASTPSNERYIAASEVLVAAAKAMDLEMFKVADDSLRRNIRTKQITTDPWEQFVRAVAAGKKGEELLPSFLQMDPEKLTRRGRINLLALAKVGNVLAESLVNLERQVATEIVSSDYIDRPTDYDAGWLAAKVLTDPPVIDRARVEAALQHISKFVLAGDDATNDPFGLGQLITEFASAKNESK